MALSAAWHDERPYAEQLKMGCLRIGGDVAKKDMSGFGGFAYPDTHGRRLRARMNRPLPRNERRLVGIDDSDTEIAFVHQQFALDDQGVVGGEATHCVLMQWVRQRVTPLLGRCLGFDEGPADGPRHGVAYETRNPGREPDLRAVVNLRLMREQPSDLQCHLRSS